MDIAALHQLFLSHPRICTDTRKIEKGSIFFALKGDNFNGNAFAEQAIQSGCSFAVIDEAKYAHTTNAILVNDVLETLQELARYHRKIWNKKIIALTGSNGKTTTKELIHAVLKQKFNCLATKGNLNNHIGVPLTLLELRDEHEVAIIEMGANHQKEIAALSSIALPDMGLITNIGKAHLEGFGGEAGVLKGKGELYDFLRASNGLVFMHSADQKLRSISHGLNLLKYGFSNDDHVKGKLKHGGVMLEIELTIGEKSISIQSNLTGEYNAVNILGAAAIGNYFNLSLEQIKAGIESYFPDNNRSQVAKTKFNTVIMDAYNANPSSMQLAIENLNGIDQSAKYFILGDMREMGEYAAQEHKGILQKLSSTNLKGILVGEEFYKYRNDFPYSFFRTTEDAIDFLKQHPIKNTMVLVKGSRGIKLEKVYDFL